ncbi:galactokinase [Facklamia sp. DSM 111018]|uniref:Galactokinase n=1 Tax=Facklamia lactis TaxID=2749967 RepID=A0ABS0LS30_9LACT|nr:galactokinase [Facklamia lactis]MBG9986976.1 galactokinase [Facklamia lactis]
MDQEQLHKEFKRIFQRPAERVFFSPGRVNLIGEHTDYNGGHVFPCAITFGTYGLVARRDDHQIVCHSLNFEQDGLKAFSTETIQYEEEDGWLNYIKGMVKYLQEEAGQIVKGFDFLIYGNIPNGAGLSSSASIELLVGVIVNQLADLQLNLIQLVKLGQKVENAFIGVNSGIMDQFAIGMGQAEQAIFLDVNTLEYELVPAEFGEYCLLIMNTNKRRELADSKYNERRSQCEAALKKLQAELSINSLGDLTEAEFEQNRYLIDDETLEARAKHAVYENVRTIKAREALSGNDLMTFAQLMNQSHDSLREDYDVTGIELDTLVEAAREQDGVLGARMTGAGMGGCAIALVHKRKLEQVQEAIAERYTSEIGYSPDFYVANVGAGTQEIPR